MSFLLFVIFLLYYDIGESVMRMQSKAAGRKSIMAQKVTKESYASAPNFFPMPQCSAFSNNTTGYTLASLRKGTRSTTTENKI